MPNGGLFRATNKISTSFPRKRESRSKILRSSRRMTVLFGSLRKIRKFLNLSSWDRALLLEAFFLMLTLRLALLVFPFLKLRRWVKEHPLKPNRSTRHCEEAGAPPQAGKPTCPPKGGRGNLKPRLLQSLRSLAMTQKVQS